MSIRFRVGSGPVQFRRNLYHYTGGLVVMRFKGPLTEPSSCLCCSCRWQDSAGRCCCSVVAFWMGSVAFAGVVRLVLLCAALVCSVFTKAGKGRAYSRSQKVGTSLASCP